MPHYWPADRVPVLGVSYCHLIQGIFAVILLSFIGYIIFGLPWYYKKCAKSFKNGSFLPEGADSFWHFFHHLHILTIQISHWTSLLLLIWVLGRNTFLWKPFRWTVFIQHGRLILRKLGFLEHRFLIRRPVRWWRGIFFWLVFRRLAFLVCFFSIG